MCKSARRLEDLLCLQWMVATFCPWSKWKVRDSNYCFYAHFTDVEYLSQGKRKVERQAGSRQ